MVMPLDDWLERASASRASTSRPGFLSHVFRVMLVAGSMLLIGAVVLKVTEWLSLLLGILSAVMILTIFSCVGIIAIAGGTYLSLRHFAPNSIWHPVVAAALLGLFPVGLTFHGDSGSIRFVIFLTTTVTAVIAAFVIRSRLRRADRSLERDQ